MLEEVSIADVLVGLRFTPAPPVQTYSFEGV